MSGDMTFGAFKLQLITLVDAKGFYDLIHRNFEALKNTFAGTVAKTQTLEETETFIRIALSDCMKKIYFPFLIKDTSANSIVGFIDLKNINWEIPKTEIGYFIDRDYKGKGVASNALKKVIDFSFYELNMKKLFLRTAKSNLASQRVAEKNGFEKEGVIKKDYRTSDGEIIDLVYYGLVNEDI